MLDILLPVNRLSIHLEESLDSISEAQQYLLDELQLESELIVITNGVDEQIFQDIEFRVKQSKLSKYRIIKTETCGISSALNCGLQTSNSPLIARVDDDDLVSTTRFVRQIEAFKADAELLLVGTYAILIDQNGKELGRLRHPNTYNQIQEFLFFQNCFVHSSVMFRREILTVVGMYRSELDGVEDYDLWRRISRCGKAINLPEYLSKHRIYPEQTTYKVNRKTKKRLARFFFQIVEQEIQYQDLSLLKKKRISHSVFALNLARRYFSLVSKKRVLALLYLAKFWIVYPTFSTKLLLRILKFKWFSR